MISIIGAGPSGSYLAYLLAKEGKQVHVFEEHEEIGKPIQCTGLVTGAIKDLIGLRDDFIVNMISKVRVYAPDGEYADFTLREPNYIFDRGKFDQYIAEMAILQGARFHLKKKFVSFSEGKIRFLDGDLFETDYLIGADGPMSSVAKNTGMFGERKFMNGMQARVKGEFVKDRFDVYLGEKYFGWSVPENEEFSRVGVVCYENPKEHFDLLMGKFNGEIIEYQSGLIPVYKSGIKCRKDNVFLLGDAATQCKGSTHGGIIQGMIAAQALKDAICDNGDYDKLWRKKLGRDLYVHLKIREKLDKMSEKDLNYMVKLVKQERVKKILEETDRDFAFKIGVNLLLKEPRFLRLF